MTRSSSPRAMEGSVSRSAAVSAPFREHHAVVVDERGAEPGQRLGGGETTVQQEQGFARALDLVVRR